MLPEEPLFLQFAVAGLEAAGMDSMLNGVNGRIEGAIASELRQVTLADLVEQYVGVGV